MPGFFVRSIATATTGVPVPWLANYTTDHRSPLEERWAGWYVTGSSGSRHHLGNVQISDPRAQDLPPWTSDRALPSMASRIDSDTSLSPHSDIVALLVFNHQAHMMNLLTRLGWMARIAQHEGRSVETLSAAVTDLVDYMLFVDETPIDDVRGTSGFAERFAAGGRRDTRGRSLRELDLKTRLFRYPCSYMIESAAFDALPDDARNAVYRRLKAVLSGVDRAPKYSRITPTDSSAILEILRDIKPDLPAGF